MEFSIKSVNPEKQGGACVVVGVFESRKLTPAAEEINKASGAYLSGILDNGDMDGKAGTSLLLHRVPSLVCNRVLLIGLGKEKEFRDKEYGAAIRSAVKALEATGAADATLFLTAIPVKKRSVVWRIRQAALIAQETVYRFEQFKSQKNDTPRTLLKLTLAVERKNEVAAAERALTQGLAIAEGVALARTLGNLPGNVCTPAYLAETPIQIAKDHSLDCQILERAEMDSLGMNSML